MRSIGLVALLIGAFLAAPEPATARGSDDPQNVQVEYAITHEGLVYTVTATNRSRTGRACIQEGLWPAHKLGTDAFQIRDSRGKQLRKLTPVSVYLGGEEIVLEPGASLTAVVDLSRHYAMKRGERYQVGFYAPFYSC